MILYSIPFSNAFYNIYNKLVYYGIPPEHWVYKGVRRIGETSFEEWDIGESVSYVVVLTDCWPSSYKIIEIGPGAKDDNSPSNFFKKYEDAIAEATKRNKQ